MAMTDRSETPANIAAERAAIEAGIAGTTLLTAYAETVEAYGDAEAHRWLEETEPERSGGVDPPGAQDGGGWGGSGAR
jgi:hypothetical protein